MLTFAAAYRHPPHTLHTTETKTQALDPHHISQMRTKQSFQQRGSSTGQSPVHCTPQRTTASRVSAASKLLLTAAKHVPPHNLFPQAKSWKGTVQHHPNADSGTQHSAVLQKLLEECDSAMSLRIAAWVQPGERARSSAQGLACSKDKGLLLPVPALGNLIFLRLYRQVVSRLEERDSHSKTPTEKAFCQNCIGCL